jgi:hypothetical protein
VFVLNTVHHETGEAQADRPSPESLTATRSGEALHEMIDALAGAVIDRFRFARATEDKNVAVEAPTRLRRNRRDAQAPRRPSRYQRVEHGNRGPESAVALSS